MIMLSDYPRSVESVKSNLNCHLLTGRLRWPGVQCLRLSSSQQALLVVSVNCLNLQRLFLTGGVFPVPEKRDRWLRLAVCHRDVKARGLL